MPPFGFSDKSVSDIQSDFDPGGKGRHPIPLGAASLSGPGKIVDQLGDRYFPIPYESNLRSDLTPQDGSSWFPQPSPNSEATFKALANGGSLPTILDSHGTVTNSVTPARTQLSRKRGHESLKRSYGNPYTQLQECYFTTVSLQVNERISSRIQRHIHIKKLVNFHPLHRSGYIG